MYSTLLEGIPYHPTQFRALIARFSVWHRKHTKIQRDCTDPVFRYAGEVVPKEEGHLTHKDEAEAF